MPPNTATIIMIKLQIIGNVGKDAIIKEVNGKKVINFSVCHTEKRKDAQGNLTEKSTWVECGKWVGADGSTKVADYIKKGTKVYCEGVPDVNAYKDQSGEAKGSLRMLVNTIELLGSNTGAAAGTAASSQPAQQGTTATPPVDDDLPF